MLMACAWPPLFIHAASILLWPDIAACLHVSTSLLSSRWRLWPGYYCWFKTRTLSRTLRSPSELCWELLSINQISWWNGQGEVPWLRVLFTVSAYFRDVFILPFPLWNWRVRWHQTHADSCLGLDENHWQPLTPVPRWTQDPCDLQLVLLGQNGTSPKPKNEASVCKPQRWWGMQHRGVSLGELCFEDMPLIMLQVWAVLL